MVSQRLKNFMENYHKLDKTDLLADQLDAALIRYFILDG